MFKLFKLFSTLLLIVFIVNICFPLAHAKQMDFSTCKHIHYDLEQVVSLVVNFVHILTAHHT